MNETYSIIERINDRKWKNNHIEIDKEVLNEKLILNSKSIFDQKMVVKMNGSYYFVNNDLIGFDRV